MRLQIPVTELRVGMFVEADVMSILHDEGVRHFMELSGAIFTETTRKRLRLSGRVHKEVDHAGGMMLRRKKQLSTMLELGVATLTINTDKCDVVPDVPELQQEFKATKQRGAIAADPDSTDSTDSAFSLDSLELPGLMQSHGVLAAETTPSTAPSGKEVPPVGGRRNFGPRGTGWMKVDTNPTTREGIMQVISFGGDTSLGASDIEEVLEKEYGIRGTIDHAMIEGLARQAAASPNRVIRGQFPIATDLDFGEPESMVYTCLEGVDESQFDFPAVKKTLAQDSLEAVLSSAVGAHLVVPEQELAIFLGNRTNEPPCAGAGVDLNEGRYRSRRFGYLYAGDTEVSVLSPIWVAPDGMSAHYICLPQPAPAALLTQASLTDLLRLAGVTTGLDETALSRLMQDAEPGSDTQAIQIAAGQVPVAAKHGHIYLAFEQGVEGAAQVLDRYEASMVSNNDMLAEITPPSMPQAGWTVTGAPLEATEGEATALMAGSNVRVEERGEKRVMLAELNGRAVVVNQVLSVRSVADVEQDVSGEFRTEPGRDTRIRGSIRAGSRVQASSSVAIDGVVEDGVQLNADEHVYVAKGVIGNATKLTSRGDVECGFVQRATVSAVGNVRVAQHAIGAQIRAGGSIRVEGSGDVGCVIGGDLVAGREIHVRSVESRGQPTSLQISGDPRIEAGLRKVATTIEFCSTNTRRIIRTLGVDNVSQVRPMLRRMDTAAKPAVVQLLKQLQTLTRNVTQAQDRRRTLQDRQEAVLTDARICVEGKIEADVRIGIGKAVTVMRQDAEALVFRRHGALVRGSHPDS